MTLSQAIIKAPHVGVRDYKAHLSTYLKNASPQIITIHGKPKKIVIEYNEMIELIDILEEFQTATLTNDIKNARNDYKNNKAIKAESIIESW